MMDDKVKSEPKDDSSEQDVVFTVYVPSDKESRDGNMSGEGRDGENQIMWVPSEIGPPPPPLYSIKQLNFSHVRRSYSLKN